MSEADFVVLPTLWTTSSEGTQQLPGEFQWYPDNALAVFIVFSAANGEIIWSFGRDLLDEAVKNGRAGYGDVQLMTSKEEDTLIMFLNSPQGEAGLMTSYKPVENFLAVTYDMVPAGTETAESEIDDFITQVLDNSAGS